MLVWDIVFWVSVTLTILVALAVPYQEIQKGMPIWLLIPMIICTLSAIPYAIVKIIQNNCRYKKLPTFFTEEQWNKARKESW